MIVSKLTSAIFAVIFAIIFTKKEKYNEQN